MEESKTANEVITTEAAQYTLFPGEEVLLELKVKEFGDSGSEDVNIQAIAKNPMGFLGKYVDRIKKLFSFKCCKCCKRVAATGEIVESGLFVVTSHRCFISKAIIESAAVEKKSPFVKLLVIGIILAIVGIPLIPAAGVGFFFIIAGVLLIAVAYITKNKKESGFTREEHEFSAFPRNVLTEYNSFTCKKELTSATKTGCCGKSVATSIYKTTLTVGLNTKGEESNIEPEKTLDLVLDPDQVSNHEQALAVVSKLAELAQQAN